jgi:hypothetical protein
MTSLVKWWDHKVEEGNRFTFRIKDDPQTLILMEDVKVTVQGKTVAYAELSQILSSLQVRSIRVNLKRDPDNHDRITEADFY